MATWLGPPVIKRDLGTDGGSFTRSPAIIVLHSTEGTGTSDYQDGAVAPHFTIDTTSGEMWQHVPLNRAARALKNASGGAETNRGGAIQIEIIGTCDPKHKDDPKWEYLPAMGAAAAGRINTLLELIHDAIPAIPLTASVPFEPYPEPSYGDGYPRMSASDWGKYKGVCGHMHVCENSHGDPGDIPIDLILSGASGSGDDEMMGIVEVEDEAPEFLYTGTALVWIQDTDHRSRIMGEYEKQTGRQLIYTRISSRGPIEAGYYGWLPLNAPAPSSWDFSMHRQIYTPE